MSKVRLSERVRPDCEAAPWVVQEIKKLESENERLREALTYDWDQLEACRASLREHMVEMKRLLAERDALLKVLSREVHHAEWLDKHMNFVEGEEGFQQWELKIHLPVPLSEPDKSPEAAFQRFIDATLRQEDKG